MGIRDEHHVRLKKQQEWVNSGHAYPNDIDKRVWVSVCHAHVLREDGEDDTHFCIAGRIMLKRDMGKAVFMTLEDVTGRLQIYAQKQNIGEEQYAALVDYDLGDIITCTGSLFTTRTGERTLTVQEHTLLVKSIIPFPDKFHGIADREMCYRKRYVDMMVNPSTRERFLLRSRMIDAIRSYLNRHHFLEVETPMLQVLAGGAQAQPFVTHHNALDMTLFLRIAPELYLKRLVVGGFERVFEINRNFRNEGLSTRHNPEFTMLEFYQAYARVDDMMVITEELLKEVVFALHGNYVVEYQGENIDFSKPFKVLSLKNAIALYHPDVDIDDAHKLRLWLQEKGYDDTGETLHHMHLEIFEKSIESQLIQPTFITEYPTAISPLARQNDHNKDIVDRFELFIGGYEIANAFSELNDPLEQAQRFEEQMQAKAQGDQETMPYDADYINALSYGLPPTAGEGIGIDRLAMILTNAASIKDVILFPHMRPDTQE